MSNTQKIILISLITLSLFLSGCGGTTAPEVTIAPATDTPVPIATPEPTTPEIIESESPVAEPATESEAATSTDFTPSGVGDLPPAERVDFYETRPPMIIDPNRNYQATISTDKGDIVLSLDAATSPEHVNNFVYLSRDGFYDGLTFHRVEPGFVIQGGDPLGLGTSGPGYTVPGEFDLTHVEGALAMARQGDQVNPERASSGSQFYITLAPTPFLDGAYSVFGVVVEGMDVVQAIEIGDTITEITIEEL